MFGSLDELVASSPTTSSQRLQRRVTIGLDPLFPLHLSCMVLFGVHKFIDFDALVGVTNAGTWFLFLTILPRFFPFFSCEAAKHTFSLPRSRYERNQLPGFQRCSQPGTPSYNAKNSIRLGCAHLSSWGRRRNIPARPNSSAIQSLHPPPKTHPHTEVPDQKETFLLLQDAESDNVPHVPSAQHVPSGGHES